jgi:hypothetical protein
VEQQQNLAAMLYKRFGQSGTKFGGNSYEFPARMVNAQSIGARGYRVGLPQPLMNQDVTSRVRHKFIYGTFDVAGPDIEKGKGNVNAFVNTLTDKMRSLTEMLLKDMNIQTYLDGTGVRASFTAGLTAGVGTVNRIKYLRVGMHVNVISGVDGVTVRGGNGDSDPGDSSGTYAGARFTIMAINAATPSVTLGFGSPLTAATPTNAVSGDHIVRHKAVGAELTGLGALVDDGVFNPAANVLQDIDRTSSALWKSKVFTGGGTPRDLSLNLLQLGMDLPEILSGRRINLLVGSYNARDRYLQLLVPQKRYVDQKMDGGFQVLEYNGREFLVDVDCQDDTIYLLTRESIQKFGLFDLQFVEQTGGILKHDSLSAGDVFYGFMRAICNFGATQANANSKITELTVDANYLVAY